MSRQFWSETIAWATADGTAVNTTTTETIVFPNITIPANFMQDGRALRLTAYGRWGNTTGSPTFTWAIRWGGVSGTVLCTTPAIVSISTATTAALWKAEAILQTRSNGSSGTIFSMGEVVMAEDAVAGTFGAAAYSQTTLMCSAGVATPAAVTVDLTADTALSFTIDFSASNASNAVTGHIYILEALN